MNNAQVTHLGSLVGAQVGFIKIKRTCKMPLCMQQLSGYNRGEYCFVHSFEGEKIKDQAEVKRLEEIKSKDRLKVKKMKKRDFVVTKSKDGMKRKCHQR